MCTDWLDKQIYHIGCADDILYRMKMPVNLQVIKNTG